MPEQRPLLAIGLMLLAIICLALLDATSKYLAQKFSVPLLVWVRYLLHLLVMLAIVGSRWRSHLAASKRPALQVVRALMLLGVSSLAIATLRLLPLAQATAIFFVTPLAVAVLAGPFLGERVGAWRWLALMAGFFGMLLMVRPGSALAPAGVMLALGTAACYTASQIQTRMLSAENTLTTMLYTALVGTVGATLMLPFQWNGVMPNWREALLIASLALYGGVAQWLLFEAFRRAPASTLSPLLYTQLVWAGLLGWIVFQQFPDAISLIGIAAIVGSSIAVTLIERRLLAYRIKAAAESINT